MTRRLIMGLCVALALLAVGVWIEPTGVVLGWMDGEAFYKNRPTRYWGKVLTSSDPATQVQTHKALKEGGRSTGRQAAGRLDGHSVIDLSRQIALLDIVEDQGGPTPARPIRLGRARDGRDAIDYTRLQDGAWSDIQGRYGSGLVEIPGRQRLVAIRIQIHGDADLFKIVQATSAVGRFTCLLHSRI